MQQPKKTLLENFLSLSALQIVSYMLPLISLPYLSRVLGAANFGLVFFAFAFMQYFIMLTDFGFGLSAVREIAVNRHNKNNLSNIFSSVMFIKLILLIISALILILMILLIPKLRENSLLFIISFPMVIGNALYPVWFFQGMERMKYITFLNILSKLIFLVLIFIFVKKESDYILAPLLNSAGFLVSGAIGLYFALKQLGAELYLPKLHSIKKQFKYSSQFFLSRVSVSAYTNTNTFCLGLTGSNIMTAYYIAAEKIYNAVNGLAYPVNGALYPFIAKNRDIKTYKKIFTAACLVNFCICAFIFIFAQQFINIFFGSEMIEAYKVLRIFCIISLFVFPSMLLGYPLIAASGYVKEANESVIAGSLIHIAGLSVLFFSGRMDIYSIAFMVMLTEIIVFGIRVYCIFKYKLLEDKK